MTPVAYDLSAYEGILDRLQTRGFRFVDVTTALRDAGSGPPFVFLRHDVDYSVEVAAKLAAANARAGVTGTFFVLLRSQVYNLLSARNLDALQAIHGAGQRVGLHAHYPDDGDVAQILRDRDLCARCTGLDFEAGIAWHNATTEQLDRPNPLSESGLACTYDKRIFREATYLSDSNMRHPVETFLALEPESTPHVQWLTHPINWVLGGTDMQQVLTRTAHTVVDEAFHEFRTNRCWQGLHFEAGTRFE